MSCRTRLAQGRATELSQPRPLGERPEAFDLWLRRELDSIYGKVEDEALSPELEELLGR